MASRAQEGLAQQSEDSQVTLWGDHAQFNSKEPQGVWVSIGRVGLTGEVVPTLGPGGPGRPAVPSRPLMP